MNTGLERWERLAGALPLLLAAWGCGHGHGESGQVVPPGAARAPADQVPASVKVAGATFTFGFPSWRTTSSVTVGSYAIAKTPTTVKQYRQCVAAGACQVPSASGGACAAAQTPIIEGPTYAEESEADGLPVTCAAPAQAAAYCAWVGGALPTVEQWVYAARGPNVQEYAWGPTRPTCDLHPRALPVRPPATGCCNGCNPDSYFAVGQRSAAESVNGLADVLLTSGELVGSHAGAPVSACAAATGACVVRGLYPGAIDAATPVSSGAPSGARADVAVAFRCAFEVKQ